MAKALEHDSLNFTIRVQDVVQSVGQHCGEITHNLIVM